MSDRAVPETVEVTATRKVMLEQYEPVSAHVTQTYDVPGGIGKDEFEEWRAECQDEVMAAAEEAAMRRHEEHVRDEAFGDE